jgi:Plasmid pRiA4b ORF-3-like protein
MHDGQMPKASTCSDPSVYELRVVLRGVSPLIWRRVLVIGDPTVAKLHATLQLVLGWTDEHLNRFGIHGREYGVSHVGSLGVRDDSRQLRLVDLGLRVGERFLYEYDFTDSWQHDVRLERILPLEPGRRYPVCVGGRCAVPPEALTS